MRSEPSRKEIVKMCFIHRNLYFSYSGQSIKLTLEGWQKNTLLTSVWGLTTREPQHSYNPGNKYRYHVASILAWFGLTWELVRGSPGSPNSKFQRTPSVLLKSNKTRSKWSFLFNHDLKENCIKIIISRSDYHLVWPQIKTSINALQYRIVFSQDLY